jgi:hypothetical protein
MRSPSSRVLANLASVYQALGPTSGAAQSDTIGGPLWQYSSTPTYSNIPCTAQAGEYDEIVDAQERVTRIRHWRLMASGPWRVKARDKIIYTTVRGLTHTLYVADERDEAGRDAAFTVKCVERI